MGQQSLCAECGEYVSHQPCKKHWSAQCIKLRFAPVPDEQPQSKTSPLNPNSVSD